MPGLTQGARIALRARLAPPPPMALPGTYDFARAAWFQGIGAVGKSLGPVRLLAPGEPAGAERARESLRSHIAERLPGSAGGIAIALVTGDQNGVGEEDAEAMRRSGLAHLLSVSGLHIAAVVGFAMVLTLRPARAFPGAGAALQPDPGRRCRRCRGGGGLYDPHRNAGPDRAKLRRRAPHPCRNRARPRCAEHAAGRGRRADRAPVPARVRRRRELPDELRGGNGHRRLALGEMGEALVLAARRGCGEASRPGHPGARGNRARSGIRADPDRLVSLPPRWALRRRGQYRRHPAHDLRRDAARGAGTDPRLGRRRRALVVAGRPIDRLPAVDRASRRRRQGRGCRASVHAGLGLRGDGRRGPVDLHLGASRAPLRSRPGGHRRGRCGADAASGPAGDRRWPTPRRRGENGRPALLRPRTGDYVRDTLERSGGLRRRAGLARRAGLRAMFEGRLRRDHRARRPPLASAGDAKPRFPRLAIVHHRLLGLRHRRLGPALARSLHAALAQARSTGVTAQRGPCDPARLTSASSERKRADR